MAVTPSIAEVLPPDVQIPDLGESVRDNLVRNNDHRWDWPFSMALQSPPWDSERIVGLSVICDADNDQTLSQECCDSAGCLLDYIERADPMEVFEAAVFLSQHGKEIFPEAIFPEAIFSEAYTAE